MHYVVQKEENDERSLLAIYLKKDFGPDELFEFIDCMETEIAKRNSYDLELVKNAKEYLLDWINDYPETFEEYKKYLHYLDKLNWLARKNINIYFTQLSANKEKDIIKKHPELRCSLLNLGTDNNHHKKALNEYYRDRLNEIANERIGLSL